MADSRHLQQITEEELTVVTDALLKDIKPYIEDIRAGKRIDKKQYARALHGLQHELMLISQMAFSQLDELNNGKSDSSSPISHQRYANIFNNLSEIIKRNIIVQTTFEDMASWLECWAHVGQLSLESRDFFTTHFITSSITSAISFYGPFLQTLSSETKTFIQTAQDLNIGVYLSDEARYQALEKEGKNFIPYFGSYKSKIEFANTNKDNAQEDFNKLAASTTSKEEKQKFSNTHQEIISNYEKEIQNTSEMLQRLINKCKSLQTTPGYVYGALIQKNLGDNCLFFNFEARMFELRKNWFETSLGNQSDLIQQYASKFGSYVSSFRLSQTPETSTSDIEFSSQELALSESNPLKFRCIAASKLCNALNNLSSLASIKTLDDVSNLIDQISGVLSFIDILLENPAISKHTSLHQMKSFLDGRPGFNFPIHFKVMLDELPALLVNFKNFVSNTFSEKVAETIAETSVQKPPMEAVIVERSSTLRM